MAKKTATKETAAVRQPAADISPVGETDGLAVALAYAAAAKDIATNVKAAEISPGTYDVKATFTLTVWGRLVKSEDTEAKVPRRFDLARILAHVCGSLKVPRDRTVDLLASAIVRSWNSDDAPHLIGRIEDAQTAMARAEIAAPTAETRPRAGALKVAARDVDLVQFQGTWKGIQPEK